MGYNSFSYNLHIKFECFLTEIFCMLFYLKVKVRTEFSNVWGEYSYPYIQCIYKVHVLPYLMIFCKEISHNIHATLPRYQIQLYVVATFCSAFYKN